MFELVDGRAATPLYQALSSERSGRARVQTIMLSETSVSCLFDYTGPSVVVDRVRTIIQTGAQPCILYSDIIVDTEKHIRFMMTWRRPENTTTEGVSLEHVMLDTVGPGGLLFGRVEEGIIGYKAAAPGGKGLSEFLAAAQASFGTRFTVRPIRAGPFRPGWEIDDTPRRVDPEEEALLSAALANGYYDEPKRCGVRELGSALGVSKSVVARRLRDLERRALERMVS